MGASAQVDLSYIGQGPTGAGQLIADQTSGPKAKTLYGYGTIISGSNATSVQIAYIDGVQTLGKTIVLSLQSVTAAATINGVANQAIYSSVQGDGQVKVNDSLVVAGFTNSGNNGTFTVNAVSSTGIQVTNSGAVAETNPAGVGTDTQGGLPVWVDLFYAGNANDSSTAAALFQTGTNKMYLGAVTTTGFEIYYPTVTTSGVTISFGAIIAFSS